MKQSRFRPSSYLHITIFVLARQDVHHQTAAQLQEFILRQALLCDEVRMLMIIQPVWVGVPCWVAVKQKAKTVRSWLILHSLFHCFQCCALLYRLPFQYIHICWLFLDADWFPSAIMTPFTTACQNKHVTV